LFLAFLFSLSSNNQIKQKNMGRGDKKTAKGKRTIGSFGKTRPRKAKKAAAKKAAKKA
jgi:30S ribosomal protein S31